MKSKFLIDNTAKFKLHSEYGASGDQPQAIAKIVEGLKQGLPKQTLLGVTGSGKTFAVANIIAELNRPTLILAHNKTLAAQLYSEFKELFPENAVSYFVSYYDYYQPEAYIPKSDLYIEKDSAINEEIDKLRHAATKSLLERRDTIVVASVSCIYGLGDPQNYFDMMLYLEQGDKIERNDILKKLVTLQYKRNDIEFKTGTFRVRGDVIEICPADESEKSLRIELFGNEIETLSEIDKITGKILRKLSRICIYPASHYVTSLEQLKKAIATISAELKEQLVALERAGKVLEASRLEQRTLYDLEMIEEMGFCSGIENYSRHLTGRNSGEAPPTLLDYFPPDALFFIDESHTTLPQIRGMYHGDFSRKTTLVEHGFRLPSALDNRPLKYAEFLQKVKQVVYISATPGEEELRESKGQIVEMINRPTGLLDPEVEVRPAASQVEDFLAEVRMRAKKNERVLVTTLTKKMSEQLCEYYRELGVRVKYLHSEVHTLDRIDIIRGLRQGDFDLLVGINLLREGLDLPEVSLIGIMDADKEGFLRSKTSLIQTIGRAARNLNGKVILYGDKITKSMEYAINETNRRHQVQQEFNKAHGIIPTPVKRAVERIMVDGDEDATTVLDELLGLKTTYGEKLEDLKFVQGLIDKLSAEMFTAARNLEFEKATEYRNQISLLEKKLLL
ncbi:MAG: excinuclease ABC subunit UvrB [Deltaproteobacteria bacterium]|jgi:excinuclease ABC subunit B|nr:excinuclease ABC subunit UvrB [Deltaproteobacteria bacterium]